MAQRRFVALPENFDVAGEDSSSSRGRGAKEFKTFILERVKEDAFPSCATPPPVLAHFKFSSDVRQTETWRGTSTPSPF